jgi:hypothetical protein
MRSATFTKSSRSPRILPRPFSTTKLEDIEPSVNDPIGAAGNYFGSKDSGVPRHQVSGLPWGKHVFCEPEYGATALPHKRLEFLSEFSPVNKYRRLLLVASLLAYHTYLN